MNEMMIENKETISMNKKICKIQLKMTFELKCQLISFQTKKQVGSTNKLSE